MADIRGFTLDFSQLFNILQQFNKFKKHVLFQLLSTNSTSILPDLFWPELNRGPNLYIYLTQDSLPGLKFNLFNNDFLESWIVLFPATT